MIAAGYMLKKVSLRPTWVGATAVTDVYSASACCSANFADYITHWRHNGYWLFNRPDDMNEIAAQAVAQRSELTLFYYEVYENQFDGGTKAWSPVVPDPSFPTRVEKPARADLAGFDVVSFSAGNDPECSPLSCNSLADEITVNRHCLFETFEEAREALELGKFDNTEPGPFRIFAVHVVER